MSTDLRLKENLPLLTERIVNTYAEVGSISHLGYCPLPNYETIVAATEDLKELLYPGYRRRDGLHLGNVTYHVGDLIDRLHDTLTVQIGRRFATRPSATASAIPSRPATSRPSARRRPWTFSNNCPTCVRFWRWTWRRPTKATRPASRWTK